MQLDAATLTGATGSATITVTEADTAIAAGSGDLPVLATPRMIALMEQAACAALAPSLPPESTTVGVHVDVRHTAPTPIGVVVTASARVAEVSRSRIVLDVSAEQERDGVREPIGTGTHTRVVVDRATFPR